MSARFSQSHGIVPIEFAQLDNYIDGMTMDSFDMAKYNHCTILISGNDDVAGDGVLTIYGATAHDGTTAAITFTYRYTSGDVDAASSDILGAVATSAALEITGTLLESRMLVVEFDAEDMNISNVQYNHVTPVLSDAGTDGEITAVAILSEPRYEKAVMPTAVPTA